MDQWQAESSRLASAGLGQTHQVMAFQYQWNSLGLDWCWRVKSEQLYRSKNVWRKPEGFKLCQMNKPFYVRKGLHWKSVHASEYVRRSIDRGPFNGRG